MVRVVTTPAYPSISTHHKTTKPPVLSQGLRRLHPSPPHSTPLSSLTYGSRHGQHPQHAVAVEVDYTPPSCFHSLHLIGAIGLWGGALVVDRKTGRQQIKTRVKHGAAATKQIYTRLLRLPLSGSDMKSIKLVGTIRQHTDAIPS